MNMIESMSPRSGRMLKEDDSVVNIADMLEQITGGKKVTINSSVTLTPNEETVIDFQTSVRLTIVNAGTGVVNVSFDEIPADRDTFELEANHDLTGIRCNKLRLYTQAGVAEIKYIGGEI